MGEPKNDISGSEPRTPEDLETAIRERILARDTRYALAAYFFLYEALAFTQKKLKRDDPNMDIDQRHVRGQELIEGIRDYATELFGPLAPTVFRNWGLTATQDFGDIVFNLVENDLLNKTDADRREDFANGFDFDTAFDGPVEVKPQ